MPVSRTETYAIWHGIKTRCLNPNCKDYRHYGGRGIQMCERWRDSFSAFLADMGPRPGPEHSIGRLQNNGHYEPGNCAWQTKEQQANNTVHSRWIEFRGQRMTVDQAIRLTGFNRQTVWSRLRRGWTVEDALTAPLKIS